MLRLSDQATDTSDILAVALSDGRIIRELQSEVTDSMADLVKTVAQLSDTTQIELDKINGSAYLIRQHLEVQRHQSLWPWKNWLIKALELIYSGNAWRVWWILSGRSLKKYFESFLSRPRFLGLYRKRVLVPGAAVCCGFHLGYVSYGYTLFGGEVSLLEACAKPSASAGLGRSECSRCLSAECCFGTLRHHAKICHSEISRHRFFCNELVSLVKIWVRLLSYIGLSLKCSVIDIPNRDAGFRFSVGREIQMLRGDWRSLQEENVSYHRGGYSFPSRTWGCWLPATGLSNPWEIVSWLIESEISPFIIDQFCKRGN